MVKSRKYILAIETLFCSTTGLVKVSILLFYRHLGVRVVSQTFRWLTWTSIGFIAAYSIALTLAPILGCQPISAFWDQVDPIKKLKGDYKYHCFDEGADLLAASIISTVQDFITAVLPTFLCWNIQIPIRQKVALFGIFAIGYSVSALGALRSYFTWYTFYNTYDVTWATWDLLLVTMLELHIGAFCANAPALKVFFKHFFRENLTSRIGNSLYPKNRNNSGHKDSNSSMSASVLQRIGNLLGHNMSSQSRDGYISESNGGAVVDHLGGVKVEKDIQITRSLPPSADKSPKTEKHDTIDILYGRYYEDIEMGHFESIEGSPVPSTRSLNLVHEEIPKDLPALPLSPTSRNYSLPIKDLSNLPVVGPSSAEKRGSAAGANLFSPQTSPTTRPPWQTWT